MHHEYQNVRREIQMKRLSIVMVVIILLLAACSTSGNEKADAPMSKKSLTNEEMNSEEYIEKLYEDIFSKKESTSVQEYLQMSELEQEALIVEYLKVRGFIEEPATYLYHGFDDYRSQLVAANDSIGDVFDRMMKIQGPYFLRAHLVDDKWKGKIPDAVLHVTSLSEEEKQSIQSKVESITMNEFRAMPVEVQGYWLTSYAITHGFGDDGGSDLGNQLLTEIVFLPGYGTNQLGEFVTNTINKMKEYRSDTTIFSLADYRGYLEGLTVQEYNSTAPDNASQFVQAFFSAGFEGKTEEEMASFIVEDGFFIDNPSSWSMDELMDRFSQINSSAEGSKKVVIGSPEIEYNQTSLEIEEFDFPVDITTENGDVIKSFSVTVTNAEGDWKVFYMNELD